MIKMGRNLRSTRKGKDVNKDYLKLNEGSPLPEEEECSPLPAPKLSAKLSKKQKKNRKKALAKQQLSKNPSSGHASDGDVVSTDDEVCEDLLLESGALKDGAVIPTENKSKQTLSVSVSCSDDGESSSDEEEEIIEIRRAEQRLQALKKEKERLRREEKLKKIADETERLEKSLKAAKKVKKSAHSKRGKTKASDLRSMSDVVSKVDRLMDDKKLNFKNVSSDSEFLSSEADTGSEEEEKEAVKKKSEEKKKKSGKESKCTSDVIFPQKWPHSALKFHFVGKNKAYDDLSMAEFCAGYMSILKKCKPSQREARIAHMEELMYLATTRPWKSVLNYHGACLLEIERGDLNWGDNFQLHGMHSTILTNAASSNISQRAQGTFTSANGKQQLGLQSNATGCDDRAWFCKGYQRGNCSFTRDHYGYLMGENRLLRHICAKCWQAAKKQSPHPETSEACPLSKVEF